MDMVVVVVNLEAEGSVNRCHNVSLESSVCVCSCVVHVGVPVGEVGLSDIHGGVGVGLNSVNKVVEVRYRVNGSRVVEGVDSALNSILCLVDCAVMLSLEASLSVGHVVGNLSLS